ncbi:hypothetical protein GCM10011359_03670 [Nesterenkonia alkaliphila]|nr:hypothetical protein GCM10011359_03670 [Nesterenkonia alkaliphila]
MKQISGTLKQPAGCSVIIGPEFHGEFPGFYKQIALCLPGAPRGRPQTLPAQQKARLPQWEPGLPGRDLSSCSA